MTLKRVILKLVHISSALKAHRKAQKFFFVWRFLGIHKFKRNSNKWQKISIKFNVWWYMVRYTFACVYTIMVIPCDILLFYFQWTNGPSWLNPCSCHTERIYWDTEVRPWKTSQPLQDSDRISNQKWSINYLP